MARKVDLGHDLDAALAGIGHHVAQLALGVVAAVDRVAVLVYLHLGAVDAQVGIVLADCTLLAAQVMTVEGSESPLPGELWIALDLDAPALVVDQVPVQAVELVAGHEVEQALHLVDAPKVARAVEQQATPAVARLVGDTQAGHVDAARGHRQQLPQCGNAAGHAAVVAAGDVDVAWRDVETVLAGLERGVESEFYRRGAATCGGQRRSPGKALSQVLRRWQQGCVAAVDSHGVELAGASALDELHGRGHDCGSLMRVHDEAQHSGQEQGRQSHGHGLSRISYSGGVMSRVPMSCMSLST